MGNLFSMLAPGSADAPGSGDGEQSQRGADLHLAGDRSAERGEVPADGFVSITVANVATAVPSGRMRFATRRAWSVYVQADNRRRLDAEARWLRGLTHMERAGWFERIQPKRGAAGVERLRAALAALNNNAGAIEAPA